MYFIFIVYQNSYFYTILGHKYKDCGREQRQRQGGDLFPES
jgi:hypothetical protein